MSQDVEAKLRTLIFKGVKYIASEDLITMLREHARVNNDPSAEVFAQALSTMTLESAEVVRS